MLLYRLFIASYRLAIGIASLYNAKASKWVDGRKGWEEQVRALPKDEQRIWVHCSSLGEFEQGRPLIEMLKEAYPGYKLVLTFFSPSGYEACKKYSKADHILYLPLDTPGNASEFVGAINPALVVFVKYEFWYYFLREVGSRNIPLLLVSAAFRPSQAFFKWYGGFFRSILRCFTHIHVQDEASAALLNEIGITKHSVTGDTRYDRVSSIAQRSQPIPEAGRFKGDSNILIAGSTWPADETVLKENLSALPQGWKMIVAPHEIDAEHVRQVQELFPDSALFSQLAKEPDAYLRRVLIIDNIGMLSRLYAYGDVAFVGGGFAKSGIHNTLEPAIFGLPIIMGPVYEKFVEAVRLVEIGGAFAVADGKEACEVIKMLATDDARRNEIGKRLQQFMAANTGAASRICEQIKVAGWLS